jgi:hypothetical protein
MGISIFFVLSGLVLSFFVVYSSRRSVMDSLVVVLFVVVYPLIPYGDL